MSVSYTAKAIEYQLPHITLSALAYGNEDDPLLLCFHGWLDNAASFTHIMPLLENRYVVVLDWAGHGFSQHRGADAYYHFVDYLSDLYVLIQQNQWQHIDMVAHSMGGMIATVFAASFPEYVKSLTLIDSIGLLVEDPKDTGEHLRKALIQRHKPKRKEKTIHPSIDSAINARMAVSDLSYDNAKLIVERGLKPIDGGFIWRSDSRLRFLSPYRYSEAQAKSLISKISAPVLLLYGNKGIEFLTGACNTFTEYYQNIKSYELEAGHHVHMEQPEQTANYLLNFLAAHRD